MYTILKKLEHIENILMAPTTYRGLGDVKFQTDDDVILYEPELIGLNQKMSGDTGKYLIFSNGIKTSYIVGSHIANNRQISSTNSGTIYVTKIPKKVSDEVEMKAFESGKKLNDVRKGLGLDSDSLKKLVETRIDKYIEEEMAEGVDEDYTKEDIFNMQTRLNTRFRAFGTAVNPSDGVSGGYTRSDVPTVLEEHIADYLSSPDLLNLASVNHDSTKVHADKVALVRTLKSAPFNMSQLRVNNIFKFGILLAFNTPLGSQGAKLLAQLIIKGDFPNLKKLLLQRCHLGDQGIAILAPSLVELKRLTHLDLADNVLVEDSSKNIGLIALAQACSKGAMAEVTSLRLNKNQISANGLLALAHACEGGALSKLEMLSLDGNMIGGLVNDGGLGFRHLAFAVSKGGLPSLKELWLADNFINDEDVISFAKACLEGKIRLPELEVLVLNGNQFGDTGNGALAHALLNGALPALKELRTTDMNGTLLNQCEARDIISESS